MFHVQGSFLKCAAGLHGKSRCTASIKGRSIRALSLAGAERSERRAAGRCTSLESLPRAPPSSSHLLPHSSLSQSLTLDGPLRRVRTDAALSENRFPMLVVIRARQNLQHHWSTGRLCDLLSAKVLHNRRHCPFSSCRSRSVPVSLEDIDFSRPVFQVLRWSLPCTRTC